MNEQEQGVAAREILGALYNCWEHNTGIGLGQIREKGNFAKALFDTVLERLEQHYGYVECRGNSCDITAAGVIYAEDEGIVSQSTAERHRAVRTHALAYLADLYDKEGSRASAHWEMIAEGAPCPHKMDILVDLSLLKKLEYIKDMSSFTYRITDAGLRYYRGADYHDIV